MNDLATLVIQGEHLGSDVIRWAVARIRDLEAERNQYKRRVDEYEELAAKRFGEEFAVAQRIRGLEAERNAIEAKTKAETITRVEELLAQFDIPLDTRRDLRKAIRALATPTAPGAQER